MLIRVSQRATQGDLADQLGELVARRDLTLVALRVLSRICIDGARDVYETTRRMQRLVDRANLTQDERTTYEILRKQYIVGVLAATQLASHEIQAILNEERWKHVRRISG